MPLEELFADALAEWEKRGDTAFNPDEYEAEEEAAPVKPPTATRVAAQAKAPPKAKAPTGKKTLCYECGEFITEGTKCTNCGYDSSPTPPPDDDIPF